MNLVPIALQLRSQFAFRAACNAPDQEAADKLIRVYFPDWIGAKAMAQCERYAESHPGTKMVQMAGTYSLDQCQGGAQYHEAEVSRVTFADPHVRHGVSGVRISADMDTVNRSEPMPAKCKVAGKGRGDPVPVEPEGESLKEFIEREAPRLKSWGVY